MKYVDSQVADCGVRCFALVLDILGVNASPAQVRSALPHSVRGTTVRDLVQAAELFELRARAVRCEVAELVELEAPTILHWQMNHFVVLLKARRTKFLVEDPGLGSKWYSVEEMSERFTGVAIELRRSGGFKKRIKPQEMSVLKSITVTRSLVSSIAKTVLLSGFVYAFMLSVPYFTQVVVDEVAFRANEQLLGVLAFGFTVFAVMTYVSEMLRGYTINAVANIVSWDLTYNLFRKMLRLPQAWFDRRQPADVFNRFESVVPVRELVSTSITAFVLDGGLVLGATLLLGFYSKKLLLIVIGFACLGVLARIISLQKSLALSVNQLRSDIAENECRLETISNIGSLRMGNGLAAAEHRWAGKFVQAVRAGASVARLAAVVSSTQSFISNIGLIAFTYVAATEILAGRLTIGAMYAALAYRQHISAKIALVVEQLVSWRLLDLHCSRIADIAMSPAEEWKGTIRSVDFRRAIEVDGLSYRYGPRDPFVLSNLSLHLPLGGICAIRGRSGIGKSTLIGLLSGTYQVQSGSIKYDGVCLSSIDEDCFRSSLVVVGQADRAYEGSVLENICSFTMNIDAARAWEALRICELADDVASLPMGLHTEVGGITSALSAGQLQRLVIARAIYGSPRVLILDEATSSLDAATEARVLKNLRAAEISLVVVSHRSSTLELADTVVDLFGSTDVVSQLKRYAENRASAPV